MVSTVLARELGVSIDTIRRDLDELEASGALKRVHGGAVRPLPGRAAVHRPLEEDAPAKERLAALAAPLIARRDVVVLGGGTTMLHLARALPPDLRATVVTASLDVAQALRGHASVRSTCSAAAWTASRRRSPASPRSSSCARLRPDVCVVSPCGLDLDDGLTLRAREEAAGRRARWSSARGEPSFSRAGRSSAPPARTSSRAAERVDVLVTDAPDERVRALPRARASRWSTG